MSQQLDTNKKTFLERMREKKKLSLRSSMKASANTDSQTTKYGYTFANIAKTKPPIKQKHSLYILPAIEQANALDKYFCIKFLKNNLTKVNADNNKLIIRDVFKKYLDKCLDCSRKNALNFKNFQNLLIEQDIIINTIDGESYIVGYCFSQEKFINLQRPIPDPNREYTVEEVLKAGWFSENNEQGIYRRIKYGSLKAKRISAKRVVILGSALIDALSSSDNTIDI